MKLVIQRVQRASVTIDRQEHSQIGQGLLVLVGVARDDTFEKAQRLAAKTVNLRIFNDENGVMNRSVLDVGGDVMAVSQFTLLAQTRRGNRPSYIDAAGHDLAIPLYMAYCHEIEHLTRRPVATGVFGADMQVELVNDGPVTIVMEL